MKNRFILSAMTVAISGALSVTAAADERALEETIVIASRAPTELADTGVAVNVITASEMATLGYVDLANLLDAQTGISVTQDGGHGKTAAVRIRGEEGFRTRVLLDGIDISDPSSPQVSPRIEHLLTSGLNRIEVIRGPQGLLHGADAGGVIAMTSTQPREGFDANLRADGGSNGFQQYSASVGAGNELIQGSLSLTDLTDDGFNASANDAVNPDDDGYNNTTVHGNVNIQLTDRLALSGTVHDIDGENEYDNCFDMATFGTTHDCRDAYTQTAYRTAATYSGEQHSHELAYSKSETERDYYSKGALSYSTTGDNEETSLTGYWQTTDALRLSYGAELATNSLDDGSTNRERDNTGLYLEAQQRLGSSVLTAGVRHDDNDDFGTNTAWRITGVTHLPIHAGDLALRAAAGTGFRAPSLYEVAYNKGPWAYGEAANTELEQEDSQGWEVGARFTRAGNFVEIVYFDQSIENEIYFDLTSYTGYLQRSGETTSKGVELSGEFALSTSFSLVGNSTWNDTETATGEQRPYRPEWTGRMSLVFNQDNLNAAVTARLAQDAVDTLGNNMNDYTVWDASARYAFGNGLSVNARVENLTDDDYEQVPNYFNGGRIWYAGVQYDL